MLGPVDFALWFVTILVETGVLVCLLKARAFRHHFPILLYVCAGLAVDAGRYVVLITCGYTSAAYLYFYFYTGSVMTITLYFVLMSLYAQVFQDMGVSKQLRGGAMLLLAGTAWVSYQMVASSSDKLVTNFVIELSRNLYFVGVLLTYLLWGAMVKLKENRMRLMQLVLALGVYFSLFAASFALENLYYGSMIFRYVSHLMPMWLPLSWAYTFLKVPEDARMATSRILLPEEPSARQVQ